MTEQPPAIPVTEDPDVAEPVTGRAVGRDVDEVLADLDFDGEGEAADELGPVPDVVVFDVGEVLVDETRVWSVWATILGVSPLTFAAALGAAIAQGLDYEDAFDHVAPNVDWRDFEDEHERRYGGFRAEDLYLDVLPCLQELRDSGVRIVIAGNQPARRTAQLRALELPHDVMAMSADLGHDKPSRAFFDAVVQLSGAAAANHVLYVGDRVDNDVLPADAAGLRTCWVRRGPWGVLQDLPDDVAADLELDGLGELPLLLTEWQSGTQDS